MIPQYMNYTTEFFKNKRKISLVHNYILHFPIILFIGSSCDYKSTMCMYYKLIIYSLNENWCKKIDFLKGKRIRKFLIAPVYT